MDWKNISANLIAQAIWVLGIALGVIAFAYVRSVDPLLMVVYGLIAFACALVIWREGEDRVRRWRGASPTPAPPIREMAPVANPPTTSRDFGGRFRAALLFEPLVRELPPESGGGILALIRVSNPHLSSDPVTNCTARLAAILHRKPILNDAGDLEVVEHQLGLPPVYLKWTEQDGGGKTCTFTNDACLEVAHVQVVSDEFAQVQTVNESLREQYRVPLGEAHTYVIEVCDDTGRRTEHGFELERNPFLGFMPEKLTPAQSIRFKVSALWQGKAMQRVAAFNRALAHRA